MTGISVCAVSSRSDSAWPRSLRCCSVITVDWTSSTAAPASAASGPSRPAWAGVLETTAAPPPPRISWMRRATRSSLMGSR